MRSNLVTQLHLETQLSSALAKRGKKASLEARGASEAIENKGG